MERHDPTTPLRHPLTHPFGGTDVWRALQAQAARRGDATFVTWQPFDQPSSDTSWTEFVRDVAATAAGLARRGVRHGDPVLIHLDNCPEFLTSWFACAALGAIAVTTNTRSTVDELRYAASHSGVVGAVTQPRHLDTVTAAAPDLRWIAVTDHDAGVPVPDAAAGDDAFASLRSGDPDALPPRAPDPLAPMSVQYTSGTTSRPKGVLWTHANALWGARVNAAHEDLRRDDCHLVYMPLFHANALAYSTLATMWAGSRMVLLPKWSTSRFWDLSIRHGCTWLSLIGPSIAAVRTSAPDGPNPYRCFGGPVCDLPLHPELDVPTIGWWGMTETITHGIVGQLGMPNRPMSIGKAAPEYGIAVVRPDGSSVEAEETGELLIRGTPGLSLFAEYLHDPDATAAGFDEHGWFRTGDLVRPHADGFITFADRAKDMLKVGGENVAASEIERVVAGVDGVIEAAVVARRDERTDEAPVVFVIAQVDDDATLRRRIDERCDELLADFKRPREVYLVDELPRSTLRKVDKAALREVADPDADRAGAAARWVVEAAADPSGDSVT